MRPPHSHSVGSLSLRSLSQRSLSQRSLAMAGMLGAVLMAAGCGTSPAPAPAPKTAVEVAEVRPASGLATVRATGTISRAREAALSFRIPGIMSGLSVDVGDRVQAGQQLAVLDARDAAARLSQSSAELGQAERDARRLVGLVEAGSISRQQYEGAATRAASLRAAYQAAAFDSRSARLISPVSGVVLTRTAQRGEVVMPGSPIITIADTASPLVLHLPIADRDVARVTMGSNVAVRADALGGIEITGRVTRIGQQAGAQSGAIEIEVTLPPASGLRSGMVATALISATQSAVGETFARVPAEAILEANGSRAFVMLYDAARGTARRTEVRFGGFDGDDALIGGLRDGARVITGGAGYVADGAPVAVSAAIKP